MISTGQAEGTVRQLVGERFDCAGMRWIKGKAEALLHLRCIELNGDWHNSSTGFNADNKLACRGRSGVRSSPINR